MDEEEYDTTEVSLEKSSTHGAKRERTPAQKAATAKALDALAAARQAKQAEKAKPVAKPAARAPTLTVSEPGPSAAPAPAPRAAPTPRAPPAAPAHDHSEDIRALSEGLHSVISYIEHKETKKKKKAAPPPSSSEESSEEEEVVVKPKKRKPMKAAPEPNHYKLNTVDPQDVLKNIFYRNIG
jgi:hypothetical protein